MIEKIYDSWEDFCMENGYKYENGKDENEMWYDYEKNIPLYMKCYCGCVFLYKKEDIRESEYNDFGKKYTERVLCCPSCDRIFKF